jgi:hypothetical protein
LSETKAHILNRADRADVDRKMHVQIFYFKDIAALHSACSKYNSRTSAGVLFPEPSHLKSQIPNFKFQINPKFQKPNPETSSISQRIKSQRLNR